MSTTAEDLDTALSQMEPSVDETDQIAELLIGDDKPTDEDEAGDENPTGESNLDEGEESKKQDDADAEDEAAKAAESEGDDDLTWGKVLGVSDDQLSFDDDGNLVGFVSKVNGETETLTAEQLLAGYQTNKAVTTKGQQQAEEYKAFQVTMEEQKREYSTRLENVSQIEAVLERQLIAEYEQVDWDALRNSDPAEWAALKQEYATRAGQFQRIKAAIEEDRAKAGEERQQELAGQQQEYLKQQFDLMIANNPEWTDKAKRDAARGEFQDFVVDQYGFSAEEFESVFDARLIELIKDARKYHEATKVAERKRRNPVPQFQKSAGTGKKPVSKLEKLTKAASKAQGSNKRDLQATAVAELLTGSI
jgi:hypothetical protein